MASVTFTPETLNELMELVDDNKEHMKEHTYVQMCNLLMTVRKRTSNEWSRNFYPPDPSLNYTIIVRGGLYSRETDDFYKIFKFSKVEETHNRSLDGWERLIGRRVIPNDYFIEKKHIYTKTQLLEKMGRRSSPLNKDQIVDYLIARRHPLDELLNDLNTSRQV